jgi:hypothetical protein
MKSRDRGALSSSWFLTQAALQENVLMMQYVWGKT